MALTKDQIETLRKSIYFPTNEEYTEEDLREAVGITKHIKGMKYDITIGWAEVCHYIFYRFNRFSTEFKREAREHYIEEMMKYAKIEKEKATREVDECIASYIIEFIFNGLNTANRTENYLTLQQIKEGAARHCRYN